MAYVRGKKQFTIQLSHSGPPRQMLFLSQPSHVPMCGTQHWALLSTGHGLGVPTRIRTRLSRMEYKTAVIATTHLFKLCHYCFQSVVSPAQIFMRTFQGSHIFQRLFVFCGKKLLLSRKHSVPRAVVRNFPKQTVIFAHNFPIIFFNVFILNFRPLMKRCDYASITTGNAGHGQ